MPGYRRLWWTGPLNYHAYWFEIVATGWTVLVLTGSPFAVGLVLGALADRVRETTLLLVVQIAGALATGLLALLFLLGSAPLWAICLLVGLLGRGWARDFSARRALVARLHGAARVANALSLEAMTMQGSKIAATALGGALLALDGPRLAYGWLALVYLAGVGATLAVRRHEPPALPATVAGIPPIDLVRHGWSAAVRAPVVRAVLLVTVAMNVLVFPYQQLIAVIAGDLLAVGAGRMGLLAGADGIGAIVVAGALTVRTRPLRYGPVFLVGAAGAAALLLALALSRSFALSLGLRIALGACAGAFAAMQPALILARWSRTSARGRWGCWRWRSGRPRSASSWPARSAARSAPRPRSPAWRHWRWRRSRESPPAAARCWPRPSRRMDRGRRRVPQPAARMTAPRRRAASVSAAGG